MTYIVQFNEEKLWQSVTEVAQDVADQSEPIAYEYGFYSVRVDSEGEIEDIINDALEILERKPS